MLSCLRFGDGWAFGGMEDSYRSILSLAGMIEEGGK